MEWFSQNWVWVLFFAGMVAMQMFGHGGHGGHGDGRGDGRTDPKLGLFPGSAFQSAAKQESARRHSGVLECNQT